MNKYVIKLIRVYDITMIAISNIKSLLRHTLKFQLCISKIFRHEILPEI